SNLISKIFEDKQKKGQLAQSGLTLNDLADIRNVFVDILQGIFHPRINYQDAVKPARSTTKKSSGNTATATRQASRTIPSSPSGKITTEKAVVKPEQNGRTGEKAVQSSPPKPAPTVKEVDMDEDEPMTEVPRLPRTDSQMKRPDMSRVNGTKAASDTADTQTSEKVNED
ncbi:MAG: hypothetical protein ACPG7F_14175, partial [Aggregatilineales bacterium]